jgi:hypothetical protein
MLVLEFWRSCFGKRIPVCETCLGTVSAKHRPGAKKHGQGFKQMPDKWLSAAELEQLDVEELENYRDDLEHRLETINHHNLKTIIVAAIRAIDEMRARRQRPWMWED